jgi:hypothetical protein
VLGFSRQELTKLAIGAGIELALLAGIQGLVFIILEPGPFRDFARFVLSGLLLLLSAGVLMRWMDRRHGPTVLAPSQPASPGGAQVFPPSVIQEPSESVLRRNWEDAEAQVANLERARKEIKEREGILHKALDTAITWLYRRENWDGLSEDGRNTEPAPKDIWADGKYAQLGLNGVGYQPPQTIPPEPGFTPRRSGGSHGVLTVESGTPSPAQRALHQVVAVGGTDVTCSCGWRGPGPEYEAHKLLPLSDSQDQGVRGMGFAVAHRIPPTIASAPLAHQAKPLAEFCTTRNGLLARGAEFVDGLWQVSTNAKRADEQEWRAKVTAWRNAARTHHQKWWAGDQFSPPPVKGTDPPLHPPWRRELQDLITSGIQWLQEYGWACDQTSQTEDRA